jgi:hypothetical protein
VCHGPLMTYTATLSLEIYKIVLSRLLFVDMGRPLWREDGSVAYKCCWFSPAQSFSGQSPGGLMIIFYCLRFETPQIWRARFSYLYPTGTGWPRYTLRTPADRPCLQHLGTDRVENVSFVNAAFSCCRRNVLLCGAVIKLRDTHYGTSCSDR